jgi:acid phosphatase (class A)
MVRLSVLFLSLLPVGALPAAESLMSVAPAAGQPRFVDPWAIDFARGLPPPPAPDSAAARADLAAVLAAQAARTPADVAWAETVDRDQVFNLAPEVGPWFQAARLPRTEAFFRELTREIRAFERAAKVAYPRERPWVVDARVRPCVPLPTSGSYPSGTALQAGVWAELLAEAFPAAAAALRARAVRAGEARVVAGVHFPSDVAAGAALVPAFLAACRRSADFEVEWAAVRAELAAAARPPSP